VVPPRFEADDTQDDGQGKERFGAGDCAKNAGFRLSFWEPASGEAEPGSTKQGEQQTNNSGKNSRPLLPTCAGIARVLPILVERFRRDDRTEAAPSPGGNCGTWDLNVPSNGHCATTNDVFAKAMVVGASRPRRVRDGGCHPRRITCTSENLNDIEEAALANKKFRMSAYTAGLFIKVPGTSQGDIAPARGAVILITSSSRRWVCRARISPT
jgi:hypothetical protein